MVNAGQAGRMGFLLPLAVQGQQAETLWPVKASEGRILYQPAEAQRCRERAWRIIDVLLATLPPRSS